MLKTVCRRTVFALTAVLLSACGEMPPEPLRIGTNVWPGYEPLHLASELGFYGDQPVHLVEHPAATEVMRSLRNGAIEAAALTLDETLMLAQHGQELWIVLITDFSNGGDSIIGQRGLTSLADLRQRRVGVEDSALGAFMLQRSLDQADLSYEDIQPIPLAADMHERAFIEGSVDAVVTFEPVRSKLLKRGGNELFDSSRIPGEIIDVLVINPEYARRYPHVVEALRDGWYRALEHMQQHPTESAAIMAPREGLSTEEFLSAINLLKIPTREENAALLTGDNPALPATAEKLQRVLLERRLQEHPVELDTLLGYYRTLRSD